MQNLVRNSIDSCEKTLSSPGSLLDKAPAINLFLYTNMMAMLVVRKHLTIKYDMLYSKKIAAKIVYTKWRTAMHTWLMQAKTKFVICTCEYCTTLVRQPNRTLYCSLLISKSTVKFHSLMLKLSQTAFIDPAGKTGSKQCWLIPEFLWLLFPKQTRNLFQLQPLSVPKCTRKMLTILGNFIPKSV